MNKTLVYILVLLVIIGGGWYGLAGQGAGGATLNADVYPLYTGTTWGEAVATTSPDLGPIVMVQSVAATNTMDIAAASQPFTQYYDQKLTAAGWTRDMSREASGAGAEISIYTKGNDFIEVSFHSLFRVRTSDAPVQCPCDVTLVLASGSGLGPSPADLLAAKTYHDSALGFSIILPTALAQSASDSLYSVDTGYTYQAQGPNSTIPGVKFAIPASKATGTNLSSDSYVSVEHLALKSCSASPFMLDTSIKSYALKEGAVSYSVASSTDAAVGNRYDEWVFARTGTNPCIAVRYFIHYAAIGNFPPGQVKEFDEAALRQEFDQIRRTLTIPQK